MTSCQFSALSQAKSSTRVMLCHVDVVGLRAARGCALRSSFRSSIMGPAHRLTTRGLPELESRSCARAAPNPPEGRRGVRSGTAIPRRLHDLLGARQGIRTLPRRSYRTWCGLAHRCGGLPPRLWAIEETLRHVPPPTEG